MQKLCFRLEQWMTALLFYFCHILLWFCVPVSFAPQKRASLLDRKSNSLSGYVPRRWTAYNQCHYRNDLSDVCVWVCRRIGNEMEAKGGWHTHTRIHACALWRETKKTHEGGHSNHPFLITPSPLISHQRSYQSTPHPVLKISAFNFPVNRG